MILGFLFGKKEGPDRKDKKNEPDPKTLVGDIDGYYRKVNACAIKIRKGKLKIGDKIWIKGHTTDLKLTIESMEIDRKAVTEAEKGKSVGIHVKKRVRGGDGVYLLEEGPSKT